MAQISMPSGVSTYIAEAQQYDGMRVSISGTVYDVNYCGTSALYYRNPRCGYDAFLIEGQSVRTDKITQTDIYKAYDNQTLEFGRGRLVTEIIPTWKLTTGWLTDEQSERLANNLIPSSEVYFHNLEDNTIHPCVITDTQVKHKTYSNEGQHLVSYEINIEYSQTEERRYCQKGM